MVAGSEKLCEVPAILPAFLPLSVCVIDGLDEVQDEVREAGLLRRHLGHVVDVRQRLECREHLVRRVGVRRLDVVAAGRRKHDSRDHHEANHHRSLPCTAGPR